MADAETWFTTMLGGGSEFFKNSARSDVAREGTEMASRGTNFFMGTRPVLPETPPPIMAAALEDLGAAEYLSSPAGMFTWIGMYPLPPLARLLEFLGSMAVAGGTGLRGVEFPEDPLSRPLSRLVNRAIRLGALAFFLGSVWACMLMNGCAIGSGGGG